jgi:hypothetical protein
MRVARYIKESLEYNDGNNTGAKFLCNYYQELLGIADTHHKVVQTNKDRPLHEAFAKYHS